LSSADETLGGFSTGNLETLAASVWRALNSSKGHSVDQPWNKGDDMRLPRARRTGIPN
jgi:hypothetical protein